MKPEMLSTQIAHNTKVAFTRICSEMDLSPFQALKLLARTVIIHGRIPVEVNQPNSQSMHRYKNWSNTKDISTNIYNLIKENHSEDFFFPNSTQLP